MSVPSSPALPDIDLKRELRTKREELLLRTVAALPNASSTGLASSILLSTDDCLFVRWARNCMISLVASVLPAPDSPLHESIHCLSKVIRFKLQSGGNT